MIRSFQRRMMPGIIGAFLVLLSFSLHPQDEEARDTREQHSSKQDVAIEALRQDAAQFHRSDIFIEKTANNDISTIYGKLSAPLRAQSTNYAAQLFLETHAAAFNINPSNDELALIDDRTDSYGLAHVKYQQRYRGLPVYKRTVAVHFDREQSIHAVTSNFVSGINVSTAASLAEETALATVKTQNRVKKALLEESQLVIYYDDFHAKAHLAYAVTIANFKVDKTVIIDANSGRQITEFTHRHSGPVNGSGTDALGNSVNPLHVYQGTDFPLPSNSTWQSVMGSATKGNYNMVDLAHTGLGNIYGLDSRHTDLTTIDFIYSNTSAFNSVGAQRAGVSGATNFESTLDYFKVKHGRDGIDDAGMPVIHIQDWYDPNDPINAFWSGSLGYMAFSLGGTIGSTTYNPLSAATDVVAHELAHGVTDRTSGLVYQNHSGALNEAWSDMFGYLVEAYQQGSYNEWLLGEDVYANVSSAFRSLSDPTQFGDPDNISHPSYIAPVSNPTGSNDYGGVHSNSGIPNKVFYLLVNGGTHYGIAVDPFSTTITTSADQVAALMYLANTGGYFTSSSTFSQARSQTLAACAALYPGDAAKYASLENAWASVGIGSPASQPASYASLPYSTGFESGSTDQYWSTTSNNSYGRIQVSSANTPHGGSYHLTMDSNVNGNYVTNESWLHLDLSGESQVDLEFWWKEFGDETHSQDGVYFSDNGGASFVKVQDLNGQSYTNNTWQQFSLDVDALASSNGLSLSSTFVVKFQQYDNYGITTDGHAIDDISVTAGSVSNTPPTADANGPYSGTTGSSVSFSSAGSSDPDGSITGYLWNFGDGATSTSANPTHTYNSAGTFNVSLTVTDNGGAQDTDNTTATISAPPTGNYATLPYSTGFESGSFDQYWNTASTSNGRVRLLTTNTPHSGSYHMTMDDPTSGGYVTNEATLNLDLSGETNVSMTFWWKEFGDETHSQDGVYFSDNDGASYVKVQDLNGQSYTNNTWQQFNLDVDALASANGLSLSSTFVIKFQQYDNYPIATDGFAFDDIAVTGGGASYISAESESNNTSGSADGPVGSGVNVSGSVSSSSDNDWFYFDVNSAGNVNVSLSIGSSADLDWYLYHESNLSSWVARGYTTSNPEAGTYNATTTGRYYLMVDGYNGATSSYTLSVSGGLAKFTNTGKEKSDNIVPLVYALEQNYPNPFNPTTRIKFSVPETNKVSIAIYDITGQKVRTLVNGENRAAGIYEMEWDGRNDTGIKVSSGIYLYRMTAGSFVQTRRMMLLK